MRNTLAIWTFSVLALLVVACGGGGDDSSGGGGGISGPSYSGQTTQATIDETNAKSLALAATDSANSGDNVEQLGVLFDHVMTSLQNQKSGISAQAVASGSCGGSATYPDNIDQQQSPITGTISFSNYCLDGGEAGHLIVNGQMSFIVQIENNELISMAMEINHFVISYNGDTVTVNATLAFSQNGTLFEYSTDFSGSSGQTLRVENLSINNDPITGVAITSGRVYHPDNGYVDISTTENLVFDGCLNGKPVSGTVLLEGSGGSSAEMVFTGCGGYEICLNGNTTCTPYNWE